MEYNRISKQYLFRDSLSKGVFSMSKKKRLLCLSLIVLLFIAILFCSWFFGTARKLNRAEALLNAGEREAALTLLDRAAGTASQDHRYRLVVLYNKADAVDSLEGVVRGMVQDKPKDARTFAARLILDWAADIGSRDQIYAEAEAQGIDLSALTPNAPATKESDGAVVAPLTEVEIFPYRSQEQVYLEINGTKANRNSPAYSAPLLAVYGDYPISAVSLNADGVPSPTMSRTLTVTETAPVYFADPTFEAVVLGTLDETEYREVTNAEIRGIDHLILNASIGESFFADEFRSFYDLRYFAHVSRLGISQSQDLQDLSPLSGLYGMKHFALYGPLEDNFEHIASLRSLNSLSLERPMIDSLAVIQKMPALTSLRITAGEISDLSELLSHKSLTSLQLDYQNISDITPLSALTNLETLNLYDNEISDITPLLSLNKLKHLDLRQNPVDAGADLELPTLETYLIGE